MQMVYILKFTKVFFRKKKNNLREINEPCLTRTRFWIDMTRLNLDRIWRWRWTLPFPLPPTTFAPFPSPSFCYFCSSFSSFFSRSLDFASLYNKQFLTSTNHWSALRLDNSTGVNKVPYSPPWGWGNWSSLLGRNIKL